MDDLKVWEEIPTPKSIEEQLADVEAVMKHIDEKTPKGVWGREVEMKGCWLDVQECLEVLQKMGDDDELTVIMNIGGQRCSFAYTREDQMERIADKLDDYYGQSVASINDIQGKMDRAMKIEYATPATKEIDVQLMEVEGMLEHLEAKIPKGRTSRESECYGCWLDVREELENLKLMGDKDYLEFNFGTEEDPKIGRLRKEQCLDRIDYKLDLYYGTKNMHEAMEMEREMPAPKDKGRNREVDPR